MSSTIKHGNCLSRPESSLDVSVPNSKRRKKLPRKIQQHAKEDQDQEEAAESFAAVFFEEAPESAELKIKSEPSSSDDEAMVIDTTDNVEYSTPLESEKNETASVDPPKTVRRECPALLPIFPGIDSQNTNAPRGIKRPMQHTNVVQTSKIWQPPSSTTMQISESWPPVYIDKAAGRILLPVGSLFSSSEPSNLLAPPTEAEPSGPLLDVLRRNLKCLSQRVTSSPPVNDIEVDDQNTLKSLAMINKLRDFKRKMVPIDNETAFETSTCNSPRHEQQCQSRDISPASTNIETISNKVVSSASCREDRRTSSPPNVIIKTEQETPKQIRVSANEQESCNRASPPKVVIIKTEPDTSESSGEYFRNITPLPAISPELERVTSGPALSRQNVDNVVMKAGSLLLTSTLYSKPASAAADSSIQPEAIHPVQNSSLTLSRMLERRQKVPPQTISNAVMEAGTFILNDALSGELPDKHGCLKKLLKEPVKHAETVHMHEKKHLAKKKRMVLEMGTVNVASTVVDGLLLTNNQRTEPGPSSSHDWVTRSEAAALCSPRLGIDEPTEEGENSNPPVPSAAIYFKSEPPSDYEFCDVDNNKRPCPGTSLPPAENMQRNDLTAVVIKEEFDPDEIVIKEEVETEIDPFSIKMEAVDEDELQNASMLSGCSIGSVNELNESMNQNEFQISVIENTITTRNEISTVTVEKDSFRIRLEKMIEEKRSERLNSISSISKGLNSNGEEPKEFSGFSFDTCEQPEPYIVDTPTGVVKLNRRVQTDICSAFQPDQLMTFQQLTEERLMYFAGVNKYKFSVLYNFLFPRQLSHHYQQLSNEDQLLLVLFMYKHKPSKEYLSHLFDVTEKKVSNIINSITTKFRMGLNDVVLWSGTKSKCSLAAIMDCREFVTGCLKSYCPNKEIMPY